MYDSQNIALFSMVVVSIISMFAVAALFSYFSQSIAKTADSSSANVPKMTDRNTTGEVFVTIGYYAIACVAALGILYGMVNASVLISIMSALAGGLIQLMILMNRVITLASVNDSRVFLPNRDDINHRT